MNVFIEPGFNKYYSQYPLVLIDVGASGGLQPNWFPARKYLQMIGFEPDEREFHNFESGGNSNVKYLNAGLYSERTTVDYYLTEKQQASSMLKPNEKFLQKFPESQRFKIVGKKVIKTDTLDNLFDHHKINDVDFIKLDTQGSELYILEGAHQTIRNHVFGLEIEMAFSQIYENQPLFSDVDSFVRKQGFQLFDIQRNYWKRNEGINRHKKKGQLIFANVLYLRDAEDFYEIVQKIGPVDIRKGKVLKALSICFLYGYFDYASEIFNKANVLFASEEQSSVAKKIESSTHLGNKIPNFKGRRKIANMVHSLWEILQPTHNSWATADGKLGNV